MSEKSATQSALESFAKSTSIETSKLENDAAVAVNERKAGQKEPSESFEEQFLPVRKGRLTSPYGMRRIEGEWKFHQGLDIAAPEGEPIFSMCDGTVVYAERRDGLGLAVKVKKTGTKINVIYGHCSRLFVGKDQSVKREQVIAAVGHTGHVVGETGNHLHLQVDDYGKLKKGGGRDFSVDPADNKWIDMGLWVKSRGEVPRTHVKSGDSPLVQNLYAGVDSTEQARTRGMRLKFQKRYDLLLQKKINAGKRIAVRKAELAAVQGKEAQYLSVVARERVADVTGFLCENDEF